MALQEDGSSLFCNFSHLPSFPLTTENAYKQNFKFEAKAFKNVRSRNVMVNIQVLFVSRKVALNSSCTLQLTGELFKNTTA